MMENYLNPPESAKRERGCSLSEMGPKLRATMERLHKEAAMKRAFTFHPGEDDPEPAPTREYVEARIENMERWEEEERGVRP
jgi:hypothetical protein